MAFNKGDRVLVVASDMEHYGNAGTVVSAADFPDKYTVGFSGGCRHTYWANHLKAATDLELQRLIVGEENVELVSGADSKNRCSLVKTPLFLQELRRISDSSVKTPLLPDGAIFYERRGAVEVIILEEKPTVRSVYWEESYMREEKRHHIYQLAFPYVIIGFALMDGVVSKQGTPTHVFYRNLPLNSLDDPLFCSNLKNVDGCGKICFYPKTLCMVSPREAARIIRATLWSSEFNSTLLGVDCYDTFSFGTTGDILAWARKSKEDPGFVLKIVWPASGFCIKSSMASIYFYAGRAG